MAQVLGEEAPEVELIHDAEWSIFPEVGDALRAAGTEERALTVATCAARNTWAVGVGGKWKHREAAAKLALALALMPMSENAAEIASEWPGLPALCEAAGVATGLPAAPVKPAQKKQQPKAAVAPPAQRAGGKGVKGATKSSGAKGGGALPRDKPLWLNMAGEDAPEKLAAEGMPMEDVLAICSDGQRGKALSTQAEEVLKQLVSDFETDITFHDDPNWAEFEAVGKVLQKNGGKQECLCIATCPAFGAWAVGAGAKGQCRYNAALLALAATLTIQSAEFNAMPDLSEHKGFQTFIDEAQAAKS